MLILIELTPEEVYNLIIMTKYYRNNGGNLQLNADAFILNATACLFEDPGVASIFTGNMKRAYHSRAYGMHYKRQVHILNGRISAVSWNI